MGNGFVDNVDHLNNPPRQTLRISPENVQKMIAEVNAKTPEEACGLIAGQSDRALEVFPITNALHSPVSFRMDPQEQWQAFHKIDERSWELLGIYHSHPQGPERPSSTDVAECTYPDVIHLIWFPSGDEWRCRGYLIQAGVVSEVSIEVLAG